MGGRPLIGANGAGGEIGHICVNYFEEKCCGCGKKGCLEQYASATGIARIAREHLAADTKDSILQTYDLDKIDAKIVFDALKEGDQLQNGWNSKTWSVRQEKQNGLFGNYFLIRWKELPDFQ